MATFVKTAYVLLGMKTSSLISTSLIDSEGQFVAHIPQPIHISDFTREGFSSSDVMAFIGQISAHWLQEMHVEASIDARNLLGATIFFVRGNKCIAEDFTAA